MRSTAFVATTRCTPAPRATSHSSSSIHVRCWGACSTGPEFGVSTVPETVVVIAPHPDDESIGCGGAILSHTGRGDRVHVVFLTSGELGLKHLKVEEAWNIRESEARAAAGILGISQLTFLRQPDWCVGDH